MSENIPECLKMYITNQSNLKSIFIGKRYGPTDYIDFINVRDFESRQSSVVYGYDCFQRFFISVLYTSLTEPDKPKKIMTLFQRFTSNKSFFVTCGSTFLFESDVKIFEATSHGIDPQIKDFFELINKSSVGEYVLYKY